MMNRTTVTPASLTDLADLRKQLIATAADKIAKVMADGEYRTATEIAEACDNFFTPAHFANKVSYYSTPSYENVKFTTRITQKIVGYTIKCNSEGEPVLGAEPRPIYSKVTVYRMITK